MNKLIEELDKAPLYIRLLPALAAIMIIIFVFKGTSLTKISDKALLNSHILMILSFLTLLVLSFKVRSFLQGRIFGGIIYRRRGNENDEKVSDIYYKAYNVYLLSDEDNRFKEFSKIIRSRASRGLVDYMIINYISRKGNNSLLLMVSDNRLSIDMESEIFITMISSLELARAEEVTLDTDTVKSLTNIMRRYKESSGNLIMIPSLEEQIHSVKNQDYDIPIGETLDTPTPLKVGFKRSDISSHVAIFGSTGTGKSTTASIIACKTWSSLGVPVAVMDWTGEYEVLLNKVGCKVKYTIVNPINGGPIIDPLKLDTKDPDMIAEILGKALGLSWPQVYMLGSVLEENNVSSVEELTNVLEEHPEVSKWDREVKRGLLRRIGILTKGQGYTILKNSHFSPLEYSWSGITIFNLSTIRLSILRRAYVLLFLSSLFVARLNKRSSYSPLLIIIDEAHNVFDPGEIPFTDTLIAEARKLGMWLTLVTQSPSAISNSVLLNTNTKIVHAIRSAKDKLVIADTMNLKKEYIDMIDKLGTGQAILSAPSLGEPILVRVKFLN